MIKRVYLEITNSCNLNCPFCTNEKGNYFISKEKFLDYIHKIKPICNYIYLHVIGEPTIHPEFDDFLDILDKEDMNLQLVTNGTTLNKHKKILKHKCLRKLSISIHSINNLNASDEYFDTIKELIENDDKYIELRFYDLKNLDQQIYNFLLYLKENYKFIETTKNNSYRLKDNLFVLYEDLFEWPSLNNEEYGNAGYCHGGINQLAVLSNGIVTLCCLDPKGINKIGDLNESSLEDIINSPTYKEILNDFKNNKMNLDLCRHCSYRLRFSKK